MRSGGAAPLSERVCVCVCVSMSIHTIKDRRFIPLLVWIPQEEDPKAREGIY